jgi:ATP-dependent Clp protease ATP-binding subunit ClpX
MATNRWRRSGQDDARPERPADPAFDDPGTIRKALAERVKGQSDQLWRISVLLSLHLRRPAQVSAGQVPPNAVVIGPTGCGKTHTFRVAADILGIPFVAVDTTSLVPAGVIGTQIEDVMGDLVASAEDILRRAGRARRPGDTLDLAERGILFFDEFDKIRGESSDSSLSVQNRHVQRRLLKICEGAAVPVAVRNHEGHAPPVTLRTRGMLVVASGSFAGIAGDDPQQLPELSSLDLIGFGLAPELLARLPIVVQYDALRVAELTEILRDAHLSPLSMWRDYLEGLGVRLTVTDDAIDVIARRALQLQLGARGLQQVVFPVVARLVEEAMMTGTVGELVVTAELIDPHRPHLVRSGP